MQDITDLLNRVSSLRETWSRAAFLDVCRELAAATAATVDYDEGAGEGWARIVRQRELLACISRVLPLVVVSQELRSTALDRESGLGVLRVESFGAKVLRAEQGALTRAFGIKRWPAVQVSPEGFSVQELWWATV